MSYQKENSKEATIFLKKLEENIDPVVTEKKMTFREAVKIMDEFTATADLELSEDIADPQNLIFLENADFALEEAVKLRKQYLSLKYD